MSDSVTQTNSLAIGEGPAVSMSLVYAVMSETIGMVMHNAVIAERGMQAISEAATTVICSMIIAKGASGS
ncbi:MAG: RebB family R body protein [Desulfobacteraceae bacterium]